MSRTALFVLSSSLSCLAFVACTPGEPADAAARESAAKAETSAPASASTPAAAPASTSASTPAAAAAQEPAGTPALAEIRAFIASKAIDKSGASWKTSLPKPPKLAFDPAHEYFWLLNTSEGPIKIRLMPEVAPMHVSSTLYLTELGFYDGIKFHRVIPGFMAQGGDPLGTGRGGPGYKYEGEFSPTVRHSKPGLLSMANAGPGTDSSQFFLTFVPTPFLDGKHTIFGEIVEGMDNLKKLESFGSESGKPSKPLQITTAKILTD